MGSPRPHDQQGAVAVWVASFLKGEGRRRIHRTPMTNRVLFLYVSSNGNRALTSGAVEPLQKERSRRSRGTLCRPLASLKDNLKNACHDCTKV